jgi:hypothetical protein
VNYAKHSTARIDGNIHFRRESIASKIVAVHELLMQMEAAHAF